MKTVTFHLNRKGKLQPFTCHERTLLFLHLQQKHFNEGEVYCKCSCFTNISTWKDFKEPNWFQSLIKTGYHYYILIQINTLEFSERSQNVWDDLLHLVPQHNAYILFNHKTITMLSSVNYSWWNDRFKSIVCVYMTYTYTQTCVWQSKSLSDNLNFLLDHQLKIA